MFEGAKGWRGEKLLLGLGRGLGLALLLLAVAALGGLRTERIRAEETIWVDAGNREAWPILHETAALASSPSAGPPTAHGEVAATDTLTYCVYLPVVMRLRHQPPEVRALWVRRYDWTGFGYTPSPEDIRAIVEKAAYANFNVILFQVRGVADAYYRSSYEPWAARLTGTVTETLGQDPGWDPLAVAVALAHEAGLELHAWVNVYPAWWGESPPPSTTPEHMYNLFSALYDNEWVQWHEDEGPMGLGEYYLWASPGHPAVLEHILRVCGDIVGRYDVDGLHLDNVRYAGPWYSHDPVSEARFQEDKSVNPDLTWEDWQRSQVTYLVARLYDEVVSSKPGLKLTAAVWPIYQDRWGWITYDGYSGYYQDSHGWVRLGKVDAIAPMLYTRTIKDHPERFETLVRDFAAQVGGHHIYAGITADYESFDQIWERIELARQAGVGQAIFSYSFIEQRDYWDEFRQGPYAAPTPSKVKVQGSSEVRCTLGLRSKRGVSPQYPLSLSPVWGIGPSASLSSGEKRD